MKPSAHFTSTELRCPCCQKVHVEPVLLTLVEKIRSILGDIPMYPTSVYRCPEHNREIGGSPNSKHMLGLAMDFQLKDMAYAEAVKRIEAAYTAGKLPELGGIGRYPNFIHVDAWKASDGHLRRW